MPRVDLHTHSTASPDGGIRAEQYRHALKSGLLDMVAITDHNRIDFAQELQAELGDAIIIGEEIMTTEGEIIGLFLQEPVAAGQTPRQAAQAVKAQGGLVYIPHPFETVRRGLPAASLADIAQYVDIVEVYNGRAVAQNRSRLAAEWARAHHKPAAASSDAHGARGLGHTYTVVDKLPSRKDFLRHLAKARLVTARPPLTTLAHPKLNRLRKKIRRPA